jgi:peroxiredoxin
MRAQSLSQPGSESRHGHPAPRSVARALLVASVVATGLLYLDGGGRLPIIGALKQGAGDDRGATFITFESRGVHLGADAGPAPEAGKSAPGFSLVDLQGRAVNLSDFADQTVILTFWASWCPACRQDFPELQREYESLREAGLAVVAVNFEESAATANAFANEMKVTFPVLLDRDGSVTARYRVAGLPVTYIVGPGTVVKGQLFGQLRPGDIDEALRRAGFAAARNP